MEKTLKRQQRTVGAIVKIELEDGYHTYARILEVQMAFYDCRTKEELTTDIILKSAVLFVVCVYDDIITRGIWAKVSKAILPIESHIIELSKRPKYHQDFLNGKRFIFENGKEKEITQEQAIGMEGLTIWDDLSIENRLNDFYANRFNYYVYHALNGNVKEGFLNEHLYKNGQLSN